MSVTITAQAPDNVFTKRLKITKYSDGRRKVQLSSNILAMIGFEKGTKVVEQNLGWGFGYMVHLSEQMPLIRNVKRIYSREYKTKRNNPFELTFETTSKAILNSIPDDCDYVHVTLSQGKMRFLPLINKVGLRLKNMMQSKDPFSIFSACTSGIDAHAAASEGFTVDHILEYRPNEKRDKNRDLSETGALSVLANLDVKNVFNEDIEKVDVDILDAYYRINPSSLFTISLQCCEFSSLKSKKSREMSFDEGTSTLDMAYDGLRIIDKLQPPAILMEQVEGFVGSDIFKMWDLRLRKWGYRTFYKVIDARDHGGLSPRKRLFHFATTLPVSFDFPEEMQRNVEPIWNHHIDKYLGEPRATVERGKKHLYLGELRDVTHSESIRKGDECGRLRVVDQSSIHFPALTKSQRRMAKDSLYIKYKDRYLMPSLELEAEIMGLPLDFNLSINNQDTTSEILGQAVDWPVYKSIIQKVKQHFSNFLFGVNLKSSIA
ncbi:DNA cytosine methyltransferase [Vibrio crassostreae]|uniref:DNA cytosine methyltransferase n=1 Tax=Vibrio crassostreae TaxID=246167 RepID=UPI001B30326B|nr:DNA cytosine methyltransferase [Vibrio crassostreae]